MKSSNQTLKAAVACMLSLAGCSSATYTPPNGNAALHASLLGEQQAHYSVVYDFTPGESEFSPESSSALVLLNGVFFGSTDYGGPPPPTDDCGFVANGGPLGCGTIFSVSADGSFKTIHSFTGDGNGYTPYGLVAADGMLYGSANTPLKPGNLGSGGGVVFAMSATGTERVLYTFKGKADGGLPGSLVPSAGSIYGLAGLGGDLQCKISSNGCGAIFRLTPSGHGTYSEAVVHRFAGGRDGAGGSSLIVSDGTLYGTTGFGGGASGCNSKVAGCGTVFRVTASGNYSVIYRFKSFADGQYPSALYEVGGTLFGLTKAGGAYNCGTFFSLTTSGEKRILHSFKGDRDGCGPTGRLIHNGGHFLGVTAGSSLPFQSVGYFGTVFAMSATGEETILHEFRYGREGAVPVSGLTIVGGNAFGTTFAGGTKTCEENAEQTIGCGTIFEIALPAG